jgi:CSLREA domain-containing protein
MISREYAIPPARPEFTDAVRRGPAAATRALLAVAITAAFVLTLRTPPANARTYTVNTLDDSNGNRDCSLRDAINAANGAPTSGSSCVTEGGGSDTINFTVTGSIQLADGLPEITDSRLTINGPITIDCGLLFGGDLLISSTAAVKFNNLIIENSRQGGDAIFNDGTLTIANSTLTGNHSIALFNGGTLTVSNSIFSDNVGVPGGPGAIENAGSMTVTNSTFSGNGAGGEGAIENYSGSRLTVTNSTFSNNSGLSLGAIGNDADATLTVTNSTFSNNFGDFGGAIGNAGTLIVTSSSFFGNGVLLSGSSSFVDAGDIVNFSGASFIGSASLKNTILAGSTDLSGSPVSNCAGTNTDTGGGVSGTITDAGYNISDDNSCEFNATGSRNNTDPLFSSGGLANNGGPTQTIALAAGSPAIDAIPLADCTDQASPPQRIKTDQRGFPRPDFGEVFCDIGAFESQETFAGQPGAKNCHGVSATGLTNRYGSIGGAAAALGFPNVPALQIAIEAFCRA